MSSTLKKTCAVSGWPGHEELGWYKCRKCVVPVMMFFLHRERLSPQDIDETFCSVFCRDGVGRVEGG